MHPKREKKIHLHHRMDSELNRLSSERVFESREIVREVKVLF